MKTYRIKQKRELDIHKKIEELNDFDLGLSSEVYTERTDPKVKIELSDLSRMIPVINNKEQELIK